MPRQEATGRTTASGRLLARDMKASSILASGDSNYATLPITIDTVNGFGFAIWVNLRTFFNGQRIMGQQDSGGGGFDIIITGSRPDVSLRTFDSGGGATTAITRSYFPIREWVHLGVSHSSSVTKFYVNGVEVGSSSSVVIGAISASDFVIGKHPTNAFTGSNLKVSDFAFVNGRNMTEEEIVSHYLQGSVPEDVASHNLFNEGAGSIAYDSSGNGNDGTITGGTYTIDAPIKARQPVNRNLVYNGDFEYAPRVNVPQTTGGRWIDGTATGSLTNNLFGWFNFNYTNSREIAFDNQEKHSGNHSLKLSLTDTGSSVGMTNRAADSPYGIELVPGQEYKISFWCKLDVHSGTSSIGARLRVDRRTGSGSASSTTDTVVGTSTQDWTYYENTFTATGSDRVAYVEVSLIGNTGEGTLIADAWFDDIVLKPTTPVTRQLIQ